MRGGVGVVLKNVIELYNEIVSVRIVLRRQYMSK